MKKFTFLRVCCGILPSIVITSSAEAAAVDQTKNSIIDEMEVEDFQNATGRYLRISFPRFTGTILDQDMVRTMATCLVERYGIDKTDIKIIFELPDNVTVIGQNAFSAQPNEPADSAIPFMMKCLKQLNVSSQNSLEVIAAHAFSGCENFDIHVVGNRIAGKGPFPNLKRIRTRAFDGCKSLTVAPFEEKTPLTTAGTYFISGTSIKDIQIPPSLETLPLLGEKSVEQVYIPRTTKLAQIGLSNSSTTHPTIFIEQGIAASKLFRILRTMLRNISYTRPKAGQPLPVCSKIILGTPGHAAPRYEENSVILYNRRVFKGDPTDLDIPNHKLCFSSPLNIRELAKASYRSYLQHNTNPDPTFEEILRYLSPELVLYAFSQNAGQFLQSLEEENEGMYTFFAKCFILTRFFCGISCFDICRLCSAYIDPVLLRKYFLLHEVNDQDEPTPSKEIIDAIKEDNVDAFQKLSIQPIQGLTSPANVRIQGRSGYRWHPDLWRFVNGEYHPERLLPIDLAALFGAVKIFKLIQKNSDVRDFSINLFQRACIGGNSEIIHILEQQLKPSQGMVEHILERIPYPDVFQYLFDNYVPHD